MMDVQSSSSRKRKRSTRPTNTPEGGIAPDPSNGLEAEGAYLREVATSEVPHVQAEVTMQPNQHSSQANQHSLQANQHSLQANQHSLQALDSLVEEYEYETYGDDDTEEGEDIDGDGEEAEDIGDGQQGEDEDYEVDDHDAPSSPGCVEGRIEPGRVHAFLHEGVALENWRFSQEVARRELSRMIALHGLPLALVDYDGFRRTVTA